MYRTKKAVVAGHICIDITPVFPQGTKKRLEDVLLPGKLLQMNGVDVHTGGAVANTGLAMKIFGNDVSLMGKIGGDAFGKMILEILKGSEADRDMIVSPDSVTSYSVVLALPGNDRVFLHDPGANATYQSADLDWKTVESADLLHFGYPTLMRAMYRDEGVELEQMFYRARQAGTAVSLDLSAVDEDSEPGRADWERILKRVLPYVDFFVPSVEELCYMLDRPRYMEWNQKAAGRDITEIVALEEIRLLAEKALSYGTRVVLVKCGAPGLYYRSSGGEAMKELCRQLSLKPEEWLDKEGFEESFEPEAVRSGTGAGDTSIAAFLTSVLREESIKEAAAMAAAAGACCVASYDALSGLKSFEEMKAKIREGWKKIGKGD